jgi:hypothetical protein
MEWIRRRPVAAGVAGVVAVAAVLLLVVLLVSGKGGSPKAASPYDPSTYSPSADPTLAVLTPTSIPTGLKTPTAAELSKASQKALNQFGQQYTNGGLKSGHFSMPGLPGGSAYQYAPKHRILLSVSSNAPIGTIGYYIPYSPDHQSGTLKNVGHHWSLRTVSFGDPDYARIYLRSGANPASPITCTISVDGRVVTRKTTEGPYALLICQG